MYIYVFFLCKTVCVYLFLQPAVDFLRHIDVAFENKSYREFSDFSIEKQTSFYLKKSEMPSNVFNWTFFLCLK